MQSLALNITKCLRNLHRKLLSRHLLLEGCQGKGSPGGLRKLPLSHSCSTTPRGPIGRRTSSSGPHCVHLVLPCGKRPTFGKRDKNLSSGDTRSLSFSFILEDQTPHSAIFPVKFPVFTFDFPHGSSLIKCNNHSRLPVRSLKLESMC